MSIVETISKSAKTAKWVGIVMIIAGVLALIAPMAAGLSISMLIGGLFIVSGVFQLLVVFRSGSFARELLLGLLGVLGIMAGVYMIAQPGLALATLTLFLSGYFIASGVLQIVAAFQARSEKGWGWVLFGGLVSILLGAMIWSQFPLSGIWAVGTLVGIHLIFSGMTLLAIAGAVKDAASAIAD